MLSSATPRVLEATLPCLSTTRVEGAACGGTYCVMVSRMPPPLSFMLGDAETALKGGGGRLLIADVDTAEENVLGLQVRPERLQNGRFDPAGRAGGVPEIQGPSFRPSPGSQRPSRHTVRLSELPAPSARPGIFGDGSVTGYVVLVVSGFGLLGQGTV